MPHILLGPDRAGRTEDQYDTEEALRQRQGLIKDQDGHEKNGKGMGQNDQRRNGRPQATH